MAHVEVLAVLAAAILVVVVLTYLGLVTARKQQLLARAGGLPLAVREEHGQWMIGVGRFEGDELWWYSAFGIARRPSRTFRRSQLEITGQRGRRAEESMLPAGAVIVECHNDTERLALSFAPGAVTGFLSWLESSAPR